MRIPRRPPALAYPSTPPRQHVVIIGAGLCGLATAIATALSSRGPRPLITVLEAAPALHEIGAGLQITPNGARLLRRWRVPLPAGSSTPATLSIRRGPGPDATSLLAHRRGYDDEMRRRYGAPLWCLHRADLQRSLARRATGLGVRLRLGAAVRDVVVDGGRKAVVVLESGESVRGDVVVAADGLWSVARARVLGGAAEKPRPTGDMAYRVVLRADALTRDAELKGLVARPGLEAWVGPRRHVMAYGIRGGELFNMVFLAPDNLPPGGEARQEADVGEMKQAYGAWDPLLHRLLSHVSHVDKWRLMQAPPLTTWLHPTGPFALAGDACHAMLPYLAQGANASLEDAAVLGFLLGKAFSSSSSSSGNAPPIRAALEQYEKLRKGRAEAMMHEAAVHRTYFHLDDGQEQQHRDTQEFSTSFNDDRRAQWTMPKGQPWIFGYDAYAEVEKAFAREPF